MPNQPAPWDIYKQALTPLKFGDPLWEPGPIYSYKRVRPGDVGYIRRGRFHLLFSAGIPLGPRVLSIDVPSTFEPLNVGPIIPGEVRSPGYLRTDTVREIGVDVGGSVTVACPVEPGARVAFALTHKQGAALITKHSTYREDIERERTFENYIKQHYDSWVDFARELGHGENIRPVLVTGVDLTREFATVAYSDNHTRMECEFSAGVPAVASASMSVWGSWRTQGLVHTNCGPRPFPTRGNRIANESHTLESMIPDEYNQCVFVRYYTIRRRFFIPMVLKAGAGPHQPQKGSPEDDDASQEIPLVFSEDDLMEVDYPGAGSPANTSDGVVHNVPLVGLEHYPYLLSLTNWTKDDRDDFDVVAEFIFQRSNARSMLLHHRDIQDILQRDEEPIRLLDESGVARRVEIDENGVGQLVRTAVTASSAQLWELASSEPDTLHTVPEPSPTLDLGSAPSSAAPPVASGSRTDENLKLERKRKGGKKTEFTMDETLHDRRLFAVGPDFGVDNDRITHQQVGPNSRATMSYIFGGNSQRMISYPSPEKRRAHGFDSALLFPNRKFNPFLPTKIGERGLLFRLDHKLEQWIDGEGGVGPYHLMMHHTSDDYCYFGDYEFVRVDPVTKDEWKIQPPQVKDNWVKHALKTSTGEQTRARVFLRRDLGREPTKAEVDATKKDKSLKDRVTMAQITEDLNSGVEQLVVWGMKCVGYNYEFERHLADNLEEANAYVSDR